MVLFQTPSNPRSSLLLMLLNIADRLGQKILFIEFDILATEGRRLNFCQSAFTSLQLRQCFVLWIFPFELSRILEEMEHYYWIFFALEIPFGFLSNFVSYIWFFFLLYSFKFLNYFMFFGNEHLAPDVKLETYWHLRCNCYYHKEWILQSELKNLDEAVCISHRPNTLGKGIHLTILLPAMDK